MQPPSQDAIGGPVSSKSPAQAGNIPRAGDEQADIKQVASGHHSGTPGEAIAQPGADNAAMPVKTGIPGVLGLADGMGRSAAVIGQMQRVPEARLKHAWEKWQEEGLFPQQTERQEDAQSAARPAAQPDQNAAAEPDQDAGGLAGAEAGGKDANDKRQKSGGMEESPRQADEGSGKDVQCQALRSRRQITLSDGKPSKGKDPEASTHQRRLKRKRPSAWGTHGVWDEPYDEAAARATIQRLAAHWHRQDLRGSHATATAASANEAAAAGTGEAAGNGLPSSTPKSQAEADGRPRGTGAGAAAAAVNIVCEHKACSAKVCMCHTLTLHPFVILCYQGHALTGRLLTYKR
jgi:hypothetical protein